MSAEHRTVRLLNLETDETVTVTAEVEDLKLRDRLNIQDEHADEAAVTQAAERALIAYRKEHPGDYMIVDINRGDGS